MKSLLMTLGFASFSILAVNAQDATEVPDQPIDETQEEVVEMQGENADSKINQETDQTGMVSIEESELPEEVTQGLQDSEFGQSTIEEAFVLDKEAIDKLMESNADEINVGDQVPDMLYQLEVKSEDKENVLYFNEEGELLGSKSM